MPPASDRPAEPDRLTHAQALEAMAAGLWPALSPAERRARILAALGLRPLAPWTGGRLVYLDAGEG